MTIAKLPLAKDIDDFAFKAVLLFGQYAIHGSRSLIVLASG
jgi:hypothetical protein